MDNNTTTNGKVKKLISIDSDLLRKSGLLLNRYHLSSFSELVSMLIQKDLGDITISNDITSVTPNEVQNDLLKLMMSKLSIIQKLCNDIEENTYISRDCNNNILLYLQPENDNSFVSSDLKINLANRDKLHPFVKESINNHSELIRRKQLNKIEKY